MTSTVSAQFGTVAQVEVIPPFGNGVIVNPDLTGLAQQLRVDYTVTKGVGQPGVCQVRAYNLKEESRNRWAGITRRIIDFSDEFAFLDGRLVTGADLGGVSEVSTANGFGALRLSVRYSGTATTANLFEGTATRVQSQHRRHTWITDIEGGDGVMQSSSAIADKFWRSTVSMPEVIDYLVKRVMATTLATTLPPALAGYKFQGGWDATNYYATDLLDQIVELPGVNSQWWWDDGAVYITEKNTPLPTAPIVVSPQGGNGTYRMLSKPRAVEGGDVEVELLNTPQLRVGSPVTVLATKLGGTYFCRSFVHRGSNRGTRVCKTIPRLGSIGVVGFL